MKIMYSFHGVTDVVVEGSTEQECRDKMAIKIDKINELTTQWDIHKSFETVEGSNV